MNLLRAALVVLAEACAAAGAVASQRDAALSASFWAAGCFCLLMEQLLRRPVP